ERALHPLDRIGAGVLLQPLQNLGGNQGLDRNEREAERTCKIAKTDRETRPILECKAHLLATAIDAMDRPEAVKRAPADDAPADRARAHQQIRIEARYALRHGESALALPDQLVHRSNNVASDGKTAKRDMGAIGNAGDDFRHRLDFASHDRCLAPALP